MSVPALFARRQARYRWVALLPAAVAVVFAALAYEDVGSILGASPYVAVACLGPLYVVRPMSVVWALLFAAFAAYTLVMILAPVLGFGGGPLGDRVVFLALGAVPTVLLWLSRPRGEA